jgi:hypothetical protein
MNMQKIKRFAFALTLAVAFVIAPGLSNMSAVQAKDKHEKYHKEHWRKWQNHHRAVLVTYHRRFYRY